MLLCLSTTASEIGTICFPAGEEKNPNRLEIKKKGQTFCSCSSFLILCFLLFFLYSLNLHRFGFSLAGCLNSQWCYKLIDVLCRKFFASSANNASSDSPFPPFLYLNSPLLPLTVFILEVQWVCIWDAIMRIAFIKFGGGDGIFGWGLFFLIDCSEKVAGLGVVFCLPLTRNPKDQLGQKFSAAMWQFTNLLQTPILWQSQFLDILKLGVRKRSLPLSSFTCKGSRVKGTT